MIVYKIDLTTKLIFKLYKLLPVFLMNGLRKYKLAEVYSSAPVHTNLFTNYYLLNFDHLYDFLPRQTDTMRITSKF